MANMLNRAYKAQKHAALALQKTDTYEKSLLLQLDERMIFINRNLAR